MLPGWETKGTENVPHAGADKTGRRLREMLCSSGGDAGVRVGESVMEWLALIGAFLCGVWDEAIHNVNLLIWKGNEVLSLLGEENNVVSDQRIGEVCGHNATIN